MRQILLLFLCWCGAHSSFSQNLVINGDFELYDQCPQTVGSVNGYVQDVYSPKLEATTDYYNACDIEPWPCDDFGHVGIPMNSLGIQEAYDGNAYMGIYVFWTSSIDKNYREYFVLKFSEPLQKDSLYIISMVVSNSETNGMATDAIMVAFSEDAVPIEPFGFGVLAMEAHKMTDGIVTDKDNWIKLTKVYQANGGEQYMTVGNFLTDEETLLQEFDFEPFQCSSTSYVGYPQGSYYYIDGVEVEMYHEPAFFPNVFTPNGDGTNDYFRCMRAEAEIFSAHIINRWGETVYASLDGTLNWDGKWKDNDCSEGNYFYVVELFNQTTQQKELKQGFFSLRR